MATRTNLYKNPSYVYKKACSVSSALENLAVYNSITGAAQSSHNVSPFTDPCLKRRRCRHERPERGRPREKPVPVGGSGGVGGCSQRQVGDGPMSHDEYIQRRRDEVCAAPAFEELSAGVLRAPGSALQLVDYDSEEDTSESGHDLDLEQQGSSGHANDVDGVKTWCEQRYPLPGEPSCVICGKYGEYICDETDDDICSIDCKVEVLKHNHEKLAKHTTVFPANKSEKFPEEPDFHDDFWDHERNRWSRKRSRLCTFECWKCHKPGHMAEDCSVMISHQPLGFADSHNQVVLEQMKSIPLTGRLRELFRRCHLISRNMTNAKCNICCNSATLSTCLDCSTILCDSAGHLFQHIIAHPSHQNMFSHKLKRLVKCCKTTCDATNIRDLLACHYCFNKAFDKFYDMYSATWTAAGLSMIWGSISCEDHFIWHKMNCPNVVSECAYIVRQGNSHGRLSDLIF